jgi:hypothetical protein
MQPAYPTTGDMSTAAWLKQFAARLPAYAAKYQIDEAEATALQRATAVFLDGLGAQIFCVTQAILLLAAGPGASWPPSAIPWQPTMRALPRRAQAIGYHILRHAAYDPTDGCALGLESLPAEPVATVLRC